MRCGISGRPISIPSYRGFRRHLINTHKETIDAALCEFCGWRSSDEQNLHYHMEYEHKIPSSIYTFPECDVCAQILIDQNTLNQHMTEMHPNEDKNQICIYCNKVFAKEMQLFIHMKINHKKRALEDGIIDLSEDEYSSEDMKDQLESENESKLAALNKDEKKKIKIISDISLPSTVLKLESNSEVEPLNTVSTEIPRSIGIDNEEFIGLSGNVTTETNLKFVNADGNEMVLSAEQREEIMSQLNKNHGGVVMVLNEPSFQSTENAVIENQETKQVQDIGNVVDTEDITEKDQVQSEMETGMDQGNGNHDELVKTSASTGEESNECDDSHIYSDAKDVASETSKLDETFNESKESQDEADTDHMKWAENLISAHDIEDEEHTEEEEFQPDLKLKNTFVKNNESSEVSFWFRFLINYSSVLKYNNTM